jgi:hypothetical protein
MAGQYVAGGGGRRFAPELASLGSAAPFQAHAAALPGDPVRGFCAMLGQQIGEGPAGGVQHADFALRADQDGPVAIRRSGGLASRLEKIFRVCPKSSHADLIGRAPENVRPSLV